jgi:PAS domain S-box-containing protein
VFNNTYQFTGFLDPDGTLLEANDAALSFGGLDREEVVGKPLWKTYWFQASEEARSVAKTAVERARNGEMFREEIRVQGADDDAIIDFSVRPVTNEQGEVTSLIPEGRDITDRKLREQELAESEDRYRTLAENFPNGAVFLFDDDLRYQIVSGAGFDPIETTPEDLIGNTVHEVEPYSEATVEMLEPIMESTLAGNEETIELSYEGHAYKLRSIPIRDDDGEVVAGFYISQDITEPPVPRRWASSPDLRTYGRKWRRKRAPIEPRLPSKPPRRLSRRKTRARRTLAPTLPPSPPTKTRNRPREKTKPLMNPRVSLRTFPAFPASRMLALLPSLNSVTSTI